MRLPRHDHDPSPLLRGLGHAVQRGAQLPAVVGRRGNERAHRVRLGGVAGRPTQAKARESGQLRLNLGPGEVGPRHASGQVPARFQLRPQRLGLFLALRSGGLHLLPILGHHQRIGRQVVGQTGGRRIREREIELRASEPHPLGQARQFALNLFQRRPVAVGEVPRQARRSQSRRFGQHLARGNHPHMLHTLQRALRRGIVQAQRVNLVAPEFQPHGVGSLGREDVQDAAAQAEGPRRIHNQRRLVARLHEELRQRPRGHALPCAHGAVAGAEFARGDGHGLKGAHRGDHNGRAAPILTQRQARRRSQRLQRRQPLADRLHRPRDALVGQRVRLGEDAHRQGVAQVHAHLVGQRARTVGPRRDQQQRAAGALAQRGSEERAGRRGQPRVNRRMRSGPLPDPLEEIRKGRLSFQQRQKPCEVHVNPR